MARNRASCATALHRRLLRVLSFPSVVSAPDTTAHHIPHGAELLTGTPSNPSPPSADCAPPHPLQVGAAPQRASNRSAAARSTACSAGSRSRPAAD
eukprot:3761396-Prymnesium_polylepis.1